MRYYSSTAGAYTLASSCTDTASSIELSSVSGLPLQYPFTLVLDAGSISEEIVTVTGMSGTSATVTRGEDGSPAQAHQTGAAIRHMASGRDFREPQQHMATPTAHGVSSALVGVSDVQTLKNKTLDDSNAVDPDAITGLPDLLAGTRGITHRWIGLLPAGTRSSYSTLVVPALPGGEPFELYVTAELVAANAGVFLFLDGTFEAPGSPELAPGGHQFPATQADRALAATPMSFRTYWPYTSAVTFKVQTPAPYTWPNPTAFSLIVAQVPASAA